MAKPTRAVRKSSSKVPGSSVRANWRDLIQGVVEIDPDECHARIVRFLSPLGPNRTLSELEAMLDEAADVGYLADRLSAKARADYEMGKEHHAVWLEKRKSAARELLEQEKQAGRLSKQITNDMILDMVRSNWGSDYEDEKRRLEDFRAAVHSLEELPKRCQDRRNSLAKMADITLARGAPRGGR